MKVVFKKRKGLHLPLFRKLTFIKGQVVGYGIYVFNTEIIIYK